MLASLDTDTVIWIANHRVGWLSGTIVVVSAAATFGALWVALAAVLSRSVRITVATAVVVTLTDAIARVLRDSIDRPRPFVTHHSVHLLGIHPQSPALPSGHAATGFAAAAFLAVALGERRPLLLLVPASLIGLSRVYLGAHYPSDIAGGAALGLVVGAVAGVLARRLGARVIAAAPETR